MASKIPSRLTHFLKLLFYFIFLSSNSLSEFLLVYYLDKIYYFDIISLLQLVFSPLCLSRTNWTVGVGTEQAAILPARERKTAREAIAQPCGREHRYEKRKYQIWSQSRHLEGGKKRISQKCYHNVLHFVTKLVNTSRQDNM